MDSEKRKSFNEYEFMKERLVALSERIRQLEAELALTRKAHERLSLEKWAYEEKNLVTKTVIPKGVSAKSIKGKLILMGVKPEELDSFLAFARNFNTQPKEAES